jgi:hypothetical protein
MKRKRVSKTLTLKLDARLTRRLGLYAKVQRMLDDPKKSGKWTPNQVASALNEMAEWRDDLAEGLLKLFNDRYPAQGRPE